MNSHHKRFVLWVCAVFAIFSVMACEKNPAESKAEKPALPPAQSMQMDLSTFGSPSALGKAAVPTTKNNFANAAI